MEDGTLANHSAVSPHAAIAVFDSGLGGLTVVRALRAVLPNEDFIYFGDTARVPYGNKSPETVARFTSEICEFLLHFEPKCIIAACHTASASAVPDIARQLPVPVLDVVQPSAELAARRTKDEFVAVVGTEATIASGAYERAIRAHNPRIRVVQQSCPLFVPIVEEGRDFDDPITLLAIRDYLTPIRKLKPDVVLLGCTHYPVLMPALQEFLGTGVELIDSGDAVARQTRNMLADLGLLSPAERPGTVQCYVSDFPQRFSAIGARFLGEPLPHVTRASVGSWRLFQSSANRAASA
ncbi:MAG: glutamate racemase [Planctomycetes bacterium]|nr:glutamate racemase [Planctomycetota bacterium]